MSFLDSALSAIGNPSHPGIVGAVQSLFSQLVSHSEVTAKLDTLLAEHSIPLSSQQVLGFLQTQGMVQNTAEGVVGTPALTGLHEQLPQLLSQFSGQGTGGLGGLLGGFGG